MDLRTILPGGRGRGNPAGDKTVGQPDGTGNGRTIRRKTTSTISHPGEKDRAKKAHYALVQELAGAFRERNGSIICREILKNPPSTPSPTPRTAEFYKTRPCARMVVCAAELLDEYIAAHPLEETV